MPDQYKIIEAPATLTQSEVTYKLLIERISDAFISLDNDWNFTYINKKAEEIFLKPAKQILGRNIWQVFPDIIDTAFYRTCKLAAETQQYQHVEDFYESSEQLLENHIYPSATGLSIYFIDVTFKKKTAQHIIQLNERMSLATSIGSIGIWDWDLKKNELIWDSQMFKLYGLEQKNLPIAYETWRQTVHPEDRQKLDNVSLEDLKINRDHFDTLRIFWPSGEMRYLESNARLFLDTNGNPSRVIGVNMDVTEKKIAEEKSKVTETRLVNSQQLAKLGYWQQDIGSPMIWGTAEAFRLYGFVRDDGEATQDSIAKCVIDIEAVRQHLHDVMKYGDKRDFEFSVQPADGSAIRIISSLVDIEKDSSGRPLRLVGVLQDVTERKLVEERAQLHAQELSVIYNTVGDVIFLLDIEEPDKFIFANVNDAFFKTTGLTRDMVIGKYVSEVIPEPSYSMVKEKYIEAIKYNRAVKWEEQTPYPSGVKTGIVTVTPVPDAQGNPKRLVGSVFDITDRKVFEEALIEKETYLRTIIETEPDCIKLIGRDLILLDINKPGLEMIESDDLASVKGLNITHIIHEPFRPQFHEVVENVYKGNIEKFSFKINGFKGSTKWLDMVAVPLKNAAGEIISMLSVSRDVTEKIKTEEDVQLMNQELLDLSSHLQNIREEERTMIARDIHDELGQQLTALKMDIHWINKKLKIADPVIGKKLSEALALIDETVKSVRRISSNLRPSILDDLGLIAALEWHSNEMQKRSALKINFTTDMHDKSIPDNIATGIFRIYQEIITNTIRHAQAHHVNAVLHTTDGQIALEVEDDGKGMDITKINKNKTLGLIGIKERTYVLGGTFKLFSYPGKGTQIKISIPV